MSPPIAPVSDHARRTARRVATLLTKADALLITAGAGMGADSELPDDADIQHLQAVFDASGTSIREMAQPWWFEKHPETAWAWYGHRQRLYRQTHPHDGYRILRAWAQAVPCGSFVVTSNMDGQFCKAGFTDWQVVERHGSVHRYQCTVPCSDAVWDVHELPFTLDAANFRILGSLPRCPHCGALARPNVLMYDDTTWVESVRSEQQARYQRWLSGLRGKRIVVVECGAGEGGASIRRVGEQLLERSSVSLVRINPTATEADEPTFVLRLPALQALTLIHESLPDLFGGDEAASYQPRRAEIDPGLEERTEPIRLKLEPVTCVDLGRGLVTPFDGGKIGQDEDFEFMKRYGEAQSGWVPVPVCGGLEAPGYTMTARVIRSPDCEPDATAGAAIVFVQAPDEQAVMTFGLGRRADDAPLLWRLLYSSTDTPLVALDYPRVPWLARRPAAGSRDHADVLPYLAQFERVLVRSYLPFLAFIDATQKKPGGGEQA